MAQRRTHRSHAVVTGAGSGIGRAFAEELARRGGRVVCADLDLAGAKETVRRIEAANGEALATRCDVVREQDVRELAETAADWFGHAPTLVINNAGIGAGGEVVGESTLEDWRRTLDVNLWGVIHGCHVFLPALRDAGRGGVINVASAAAFTAAPRMSAYNVSKAGVLSLSETLAAELSGTGIGVTVLCPTFVKTNIFHGELIESAAAGLAQRIAGVIGFSPERVARTTLDAHDRGRLYVVPQPDARLLWLGKRLLPLPYARAAGLIGRFAPGARKEQA
ncbi:SDR family NAD(P)-dependent oxidoreductase [Amycolatopsis sp. H20-H5]|uniref:SDR family NAD(P)-dependent oxidoreductase n=1 Tax=Amycolatopsis sp. H20-H5 TaxID=3046309 RepID=UPI002DB8582A|nr:SDR family NAD(P)-dependent oxidoreductase [Amycolatopsis sp. H20-H5]MEC3977439.1 SDR family NAD(P)-dependent oxidoreductase [Amycolatopsis sp. H20-H5]